MNKLTTGNSFEVYLRCKSIQSKVTFYGAIYKSNNFFLLLLTNEQENIMLGEQLFGNKSFKFSTVKFLLKL